MNKFNSKKQQDNQTDRQTDLIIGRNPVTEALKAKKRIDKIFVNANAGGSISNIIRLANEQNIVIKRVDDRKLTYMCNGASHQGVIAVAASGEYVSVEDILEVSRKKGTQPFIIICDEIEDPHNLGAILRTAEAAGVDGIIIPKRRCASLNYTVGKTSAGASEIVPVARVSNLAQTIESLKKQGIWIFGTDAKGTDFKQADFNIPMALVIGSEGFGIGRLISEKCDFLLSIPMFGKINSLNASVAAGIFMYEAVSQRIQKKG